MPEPIVQRPSTNANAYRPLDRHRLAISFELRIAPKENPSFPETIDGRRQQPAVHAFFSTSLPQENRAADRVDPNSPNDRVDVDARHDRLVRRTELVQALTLASRLVAFACESMAAAIFGDSSASNDAFVTAWRVPNLLIPNTISCALRPSRR